jgi:hypothetical protein
MVSNQPLSNRSHRPSDAPRPMTLSEKKRLKWEQDKIELNTLQKQTKAVYSDRIESLNNLKEDKLSPRGNKEYDYLLDNFSKKSARSNLNSYIKPV